VSLKDVGKRQRVTQYAIRGGQEKPQIVEREGNGRTRGSYRTNKKICLTVPENKGNWEKRVMHQEK